MFKYARINQTKFCACRYDPRKKVFSSHISVAAEIRCICTEAGLKAMREKNFMDAIDKITAKKLNTVNLVTGSYN